MDNKQITATQAGSRHDISVVTLSGFIDLTTAEEVEQLVDSLVQVEKYNIVFDLSHADYISSSIWGVLLDKIKKIRELNGDLKLAEMKPDILEVYKVLELFRVIKSYDSLDDAISDFEA